MKALLLGSLILTLTSASVFANELPVGVDKLINRSGSLISSYDGKVDQQQRECVVKAVGDASIEIEASPALYSNPSASFSDAVETVDGNKTIYSTTEDGKSPTGSICGHEGPLLSYAKKVELTKNSLTIIEKYRCLLSGKTESIDTCVINK